MACRRTEADNCSGAQEVQELAAVAVPQHLGTSRVAQAVVGSRTHLSLTHFSLQLLLSFLHSARLTLVLSIVNEHTDFEVKTRTTDALFG